MVVRNTKSQAPLGAACVIHSQVAPNGAWDIARDSRYKQVAPIGAEVWSGYDPYALR